MGSTAIVGNIPVGVSLAESQKLLQINSHIFS